MASKRILVVEPSRNEWEFIQEIFNLRGDIADWASNEKEAYNLFDAESYDLIMIETLMPRMSGYEICSRFKKTDEGKKVPTLMMGAVLRNFNLAHEAKIKHGADDILVKPFEPFDLERKLSLYLDGIDIEKQARELQVTSGDTSITDHPFPLGGIRLNGTLEQIPFARALAIFWRLGEAGILNVFSGQVQKKIHIHGGNIVMISGGGRHETLQRILLEHDLIDEATFALSLNKMLETGRPHGEILIEMGVITPHQLFQMLLLQAEKKLLDLFCWTEGKYWFEPAIEVLPPGVIPLPIDIGKVLRKGFQSYYDELALEDIFNGKLSLAFFKIEGATERFNRLNPTPQERKIWDLCNGKTQLSLLLGKSELDPIDTLRFLYLLWCIDTVSMGQVAKEGELKSKPALDPLRRSGAEEDQEYSLHIERRFRETFQTDLLDLFDLGPNATPEEMKNKYLKACEGLYDDRVYQQADRLTKAKATAIFNRLNEAYELIGDPERLEIYRREKSAIDEKGKRGLLESEVFFQQGLRAFSEGNYHEASDLFQSALELNDQTAEYHAYLGYALYLKESEHSQMSQSLAVERINRALAINRLSPESYLFLGNIFHTNKKVEKAKEMYERVCDCQNTNLEALKALHHIYTAEKSIIEAQMSADKSQEMIDYENEINHFYAQIGTMNYFEMLGVGESIDVKNLRQAYFNLSAKYRPANLHDMADDAIKEKADEIFNRLTIAYSILSDRKKCEHYKETLLEPEVEQHLPTATMDEKQQALRFYQQGKQHIEKHEYSSGHNLFQKAKKLDPRNARNLAWLGYSLFLSAAASNESAHSLRAEAKDYIRQALTIDPVCIDAFILIGRIYLSEKKLGLAEEQFENALRVDPGNIEALQGIRQIYSVFGKKKDEIPRKVKIEASQISKQLSITRDLMREQNFFDRLGVSRSADDEQIKQAFMHLIDKYTGEQHLVNDLDKNAQSIFDSIIDQLTDAYKVLGNVNMREGYQKALNKNYLPSAEPIQLQPEESLPDKHEAIKTFVPKPKTIVQEPVAKRAKKQDLFSRIKHLFQR